ncbi:hypothetical protein EQV77_13700 [Halobacillus fulvus]|nr:hypothetical protein EQV77_13700 [Halobacillus fulvus]
MKTVARSAALLLLFLFILTIAYIKVNPPLAHGSIGTTTDRHSVIITIGNKSLFGAIHITDVSINGSLPPMEVKVQETDSSAGLMITDIATDPASQFNTEKPAPITLMPNSSPLVTDSAEQLENKVYGLSITEKNPIDKIELSYKFFGLTFIKTIQL